MTIKKYKLTGTVKYDGARPYIGRRQRDIIRGLESTRHISRFGFHELRAGDKVVIRLIDTSKEAVKSLKTMINQDAVASGIYVIFNIKGCDLIVTHDGKR